MRHEGLFTSKTAKIVYLASLLLLNSVVFRQIGPNASLWWVVAVIATAGILAIIASWVRKKDSL